MRDFIIRQLSEPIPRSFDELIARLRKIGLLPYAAAGCAFMFLVLQVRLYFPGRLNVDSTDQLHQATIGVFNDWHPPIMAMLWRILIELSGKTFSLYLLQAALYWLAIGLIADAFVRMQKYRTSLVILMAWVMPYFSITNAMVTKDSQMGLMFLLSFALVFWFRTQARRVPTAIWTLIVIFCLYGILVRANSIFAIGPLFLYFVVPNRKFGLPQIIGISTVIAVATMLLSAAFNNDILPNVKQTKPIRSLQIFDIIGIAKISGDRQWLTELKPLSSERLNACYTAYWWDSVAPWGACPEFSGMVMNIQYKPVISDRDVYPTSAKLMEIWLNSIQHHPLAYAEHRIKHFNAELNFFVPSLIRRFGIVWYSVPQNSVLETKQDYYRKSFIRWPVTWYAIALIVLIATRRDTPTLATTTARYLSVSGLLYASAYLVIGVASEDRYMYWMILSSFIAVCTVAKNIKRQITARDNATLAALAAFVIIILLGMISRLLDLQFMLN